MWNTIADYLLFVILALVMMQFLGMIGKTIGVLLILLALVTTASAQADRVKEPAPRARPVLTGNPIADIANANKSSTVLTPDQLWQKIVNANIADLTYAKALSDSIQSAGSKLRSACYGAILTAATQANGTGLKDAAGEPLKKPVPDIVTLFEQVAEIADNLQATSPLMAACSPVATAVNQDVTNLIGLIVGGGASLATLGIKLP